MKLAFRTWLEGAADKLIGQEVEPHYNDAAVDAYVWASSRPTYCTLVVNKFLAQGRNIIEEVYESPISGNLLSITDERLGRAVTVFDSYNRSRFKFYDDGEEAGNIWLRFPPVIFTAEDRVLLKSILIHELQHADDWASGKMAPRQASYSFDLKKYLGNVNEARGLFVQLKYLLRRLGDVEQIVKLLSGERPTATDGQVAPFALRSELIPVVKDFLAHFKGLGEAWGAVVAPLAVAAGLGGAPADLPPPAPNLEPPKVGYSIQQEHARTAASVVARIVQTFRFGQYVQAPGEKK